MAIPGERFELDLDADNFTFNNTVDKNPPRKAVPSIINEIRENDADDIPPAPTFKKTDSGFPQPRVRRNGSAFKRQQQRGQSGPSLSATSIPQPKPSDAAIRNRVANNHGYDPISAEKAEISRENAQKIAAMSEQDIEEARAELMATMSPALLQRFLRRANLDEDRSEKTEPTRKQPEASQARDSPPEKQLETAGEDSNSSNQPDSNDEHPEFSIEAELNATSQRSPIPPSQPSGSIHFPMPAREASSYTPLDPNSPSFLTDLRTTYFPSLTHTPSSLDWLLPNEDHPPSTSYSASLPSLPASEIRFSFTGLLLPPTTSDLLPTTLGLHHHGHAPDAAGYTIPELALLARSTMPNQRCIAFLTLGRILYRLGTGQFGGKGSELNDALWEVVENERVVEVMLECANKDGGNVSVKAHAVEAVWLWRRGNSGERGVKRSGEVRAT